MASDATLPGAWEIPLQPLPEVMPPIKVPVHLEMPSNLADLSEAEAKAVEAIVSAGRDALWTWDQDTFDTEPPPTVFDKAHEAVELLTIPLQPTDDMREAALDEYSGEPKKLDSEQLSSLWESARLSVPSISFPGQDHTWEINAFLLKGVSETQKSFNRDMAHALWHIWEVPERVGPPWNTGGWISMHGGLLNITNALRLLGDLVVGTPRNLPRYSPKEASQLVIESLVREVLAGYQNAQPFGRISEETKDVPLCQELQTPAGHDISLSPEREDSDVSKALRADVSDWQAMWRRHKHNVRKELQNTVDQGAAPELQLSALTAHGSTELQLAPDQVVEDSLAVAANRSLLKALELTELQQSQLLLAVSFERRRLQVERERSAGWAQREEQLCAEFPVRSWIYSRVEKQRYEWHDAFDASEKLKPLMADRADDLLPTYDLCETEQMKVQKAVVDNLVNLINSSEHQRRYENLSEAVVPAKQYKMKTRIWCVVRCCCALSEWFSAVLLLLCSF